MRSRARTFAHARAASGADDTIYMQPYLTGWQPIATAPRDGSAFLAYGQHTTDNVRRNRVHWRVGDHWWGIILFDVYREVGMGGSQFVFSKDGAKTWSSPTHWQPLPAPPEAKP